MHAGSDEFLDEQRKGLAELLKTFRRARIATARRAAIDSAARIQAMNARIRELARSGVRLTSISQGTAEKLIELQSEIVTTALGDAAAQLQRIADTEHVGEIARSQAEVLQAARRRIVDDIARAFTILKDAAGDVRQVAKRTSAVRSPAPQRAVRARSKRARATAAAAQRSKRKVKTKARSKVRVRRSRAT